MTHVGLVRLRSGESLAKVRDALGEVSTRLYVAIPTAEDEALASLQARLGAIYHAAFTAAPNVDTLVLLKDHRPADVSTLCGYTDERAEAENAGWHLHVLSPAEYQEYQPQPFVPEPMAEQMLREKKAATHMSETVQVHYQSGVVREYVLVVTDRHLYHCTSLDVPVTCTELWRVEALFPREEGSVGIELLQRRTDTCGVDMLYDFPTPARAEEFVQIIKTVCDSTSRRHSLGIASRLDPLYLDLAAAPSSEHEDAEQEQRRRHEEEQHHQFEEHEALRWYYDPDYVEPHSVCGPRGPCILSDLCGLSESTDSSCPLEVLEEEENGEEEEEEEERAETAESPWWEPYAADLPGRDLGELPELPEQMQRHPINYLPLVDVPHEYRSRLPAFCEWGKGAVLHMFAPIQKRDKLLPEKRLLLVTDSNLYRCKTTGVIDRCTDIDDIEELVIDGSSVGIKMQAPDNSEHDMLYDFATASLARQFTSIIEQLLRMMARYTERPWNILRHARVSHFKFNFNRPSNYRLMLREVLLKQGLHKICSAIRAADGRVRPQPEEPTQFLQESPLGYQRQPFVPKVPDLPEQMQHHPINGLPLVDVPHEYRPNFPTFCETGGGVVMHMFETIQKHCRQGSPEERLLLVTDSNLYRCKTTGIINRCTGIDQIAELIVDGRSVGIKMQAPDNSEHDMLYDFTTPARAKEFVRIVQTVQDKMRKGKTLRAQVVHQPNPGARLNFDRPKNYKFVLREVMLKERLHKMWQLLEQENRRRHETEQDRLAAEHRAKQLYEQAPPYQRQPFVPKVPDLPEQMQHHPISGLPLVDVPHKHRPNFPALCEKGKGVVMHMFEEISARDRKASVARVLVVFETSLRLYLPDGTPERWASVDQIAELIADGRSVGVKMQALDNSEHDMLYDFATPAQRSTFTEIVQTIQDKMRNRRTLWAQVVIEHNPQARLNFSRAKNYKPRTCELQTKQRLHEIAWRREAVTRRRHEREQDLFEEMYNNNNCVRQEKAEKRYSHVCMGGTFDRLHNGQKLLLSAAASRMKPGGRLFCGIAGDALFKEKALRELIQPYGRRERVVRHFLSSIRPDVVYELSELTDGYGPSINDAAIQAIVRRSWYGRDCNKKRAEKGLPPMDILPETPETNDRQRKRANIGSLLTTQLMCKRNAAQTYVIGITGGIASGKSTVCQYLEQEKTEDVEVLNADVLGHRAYDAGTDANRRIRELFPSAAAEDGTVDRKALGGCVFGAGNEGNMKKLTDIVWPVIADGIRAKIAECRKRVLVVEAAILKEAGWENICDEVWAVVVPPSVAKERLMKRNSLTAEEAEKRIASQLPSSERISTAHLLLSSHKDEAALFASVDEAWRGLLGRVDVTFESLSGDGLPQRLAGLLAASAHPATRAAHWWRELRDRYTGSGRDYHNLGHLDEMFGLLDTYRSKLARPDLVAYAIFFHDAVYDPTAKNPLNEQRSADLWRVFAAENRAAGGGVTAEDEELVASWIVRTANHMKGEASGDLAYFLDIDLAVLGRAPPHYAEYAEQISLEYNHVGFRDFARLRPLALAGFVDKPEGPYYTTDFQAAFGQRALANVRAEISRLEEISAKL